MLGSWEMTWVHKEFTVTVKPIKEIVKLCNGIMTSKPTVSLAAGNEIPDQTYTLG